MANIRMKFVRLDDASTPRLPGLDAKSVWRAPQLGRDGKLVVLEDVHMTLNEQTGLLTVKRADQRDNGRVHTFIMAFNRAWYGEAYEPDELKAVDEEMAKYRADREAADEARRGASVKAQKSA